MNAHARSIALSCVLVLMGCSSNDAGTTGATDGGARADGDSGAASGAATCTDADLRQCDYPERALAVTERAGIEVKDEKTGRTLRLLARIPAGPGPFPVVLWSHGGGFDDRGDRLGRTWGEAFASQGFVVLHVAHTMLTAEAGRAVCSLASIPDGECTVDVPGEDGPIVTVVKALDLVAVLDRLAALSRESVARGGPALDLARVASAGWSAGSRSSMLLLGAKVKTSASGPLFSASDERVRAVVALSTAGPGFGGFFDEPTASSWSTMRGPLLIGTGANDVQPDKPEQDGPGRRVAFDAQPADGTRHLLYSNLPPGVGGHATYNLDDRSSKDERLARLSRALRASALAFLDAYVNGDAHAEAWLATGNAKVLAGDVDWAKR